MCSQPGCGEAPGQFSGRAQFYCAGGLCPEMIRDFALEVWAACRPVTKWAQVAPGISGGFLLSCQKKAPRTPKEIPLFLWGRRETDLSRTIAALTATLFSAHRRGSYDLVGFWPARIVTVRLWLLWQSTGC